MKKKILIMLSVILLIIVLGAVIGGLVPHRKHFTEVFYVKGEYHYAGKDSIGMCYIDSEVDLSTVPGIGYKENEPIDLTVHFNGFRMYYTDVLGQYSRYPILVYKYEPD